MPSPWWEQELFTLESLLSSLMTQKQDDDGFWAFAAHQLGHPIAEMKARVADMPLSKDKAFMQKRVYSLSRQITLILQYKQWRASGVSLNLTFVGLHAYLSGLVEPYAQSKTHAVSFVSLTEKPIHALVDVVRAEFAIKTLIENAINHNKKGTEIWLGLSKKGEKGYKIIIADNGQGMTKSQMETLFTPYGKSDGSPGHGLGASRAKMVATAHGAELNVVSEEGKGTRFEWVGGCKTSY